MHTRALATTLVVASTVAGQVRIAEVLVDPVGANAGRQLIELRNDLPLPVDITGWHLAIAGAVTPLPALTLPGDQVLRIHVGAAGTSTPADIWLPAIANLSAAEGCLLLRGADPNDPNFVVDYVSWGGGQQGIHTAILAGVWPSSLLSVVLPAIEGPSIAHLGDAAFGNEFGPDRWYEDRTPTLGLRNDNGSIFGLEIGCPGVAVRPSLGLGRPESRPWIGERFELDVFNLPPSVAFAGLIVGATHLGPVPLAPYGLAGCDLYVSIDVTLTVAIGNGAGRFAAVVPAAAVLTGVRLFAQAVAPLPGAPNPLQALMTNAVVCTIGSR